jgi:ATP-dependent helicase/nuclease subunit B
VQVTFLLGPAGSGKTYRCLREIRAALRAEPEGPALVFFAPRQATFQLERELLADPDLPGFTRLKIVAFDAFAELLLEEFFSFRPKLLREEGRVMVLRALLAKKYTELKLFHGTARLPGFARQLGTVIDELQRRLVLPEHLLRLAPQAGATPQLSEKLQDLALLLRAYLDWLEANALQDPNRLLDLAAEQVRRAIQARKLWLGGLWLDGFSELTPQELNFLAELVPACERATLAFCTDESAALKGKPAFQWSGVHQAFKRCYKRLSALPDCQVTVTPLGRGPAENRFAQSPVLAHLEQHWAEPQPFASPELGAKPGKDAGPGTLVASAVRVFKCANPELEAVAAAREILAQVRDQGRRFREVAVLVRSLEIYHPVIRRVFTRYQIPFFLDRREPIAHHPLAELTRYALRTVLSNWEHEDWFGALKSGLAPVDAAALDELENTALARGWQGTIWLDPIRLPARPEQEQRLERLRRKIVPPFRRFLDALNTAVRQPTGAQLAEALRELWRDLGAPDTLARWSEAAAKLETGEGAGMLRAQLNHAAWEQMNRWLEDVELAFETTALPLGDWLPVVEAGLMNLTAGVIPLALDEVLVGAVDRSRNPDLQTVLVRGLNETVFPQTPARTVLLTEPDREALLALGLELDPSHAEQAVRERYLGYIACTRARQRLVLTYALRDLADHPLNPSVFIDQLRRLFPGLEPEFVPVEADWREGAHAAELVAPMLRNRLRQPGHVVQGLAQLEDLPYFRPVLARWLQVSGAKDFTRLSPGQARTLYGPELETSISQLEDYAACPFKFFVVRGLRAEERPEFAIDPRERGSFQHEALMTFHRRLQARQTRWRELSPAEARGLIGEIGTELQQSFRDGLFTTTAERRFQARALTSRLQDLIEVLVHWAGQYAFDPWQVELGFGLPGDALPAWRLDLGEGRGLKLRGRIDRVDVLPNNAESAYVVVIDYKLSGQELKPVKLEHGLDLQLLAYLGALEDLPDAQASFGAARLVPAGGFYVGLRGQGGAGKNRAEVLAGQEAARRRGYQHRGRFRSDLLPRFDSRQETRGDQFHYAVRVDGSLAERGNEALPPEDFLGLVGQVRQTLTRYGQEIFAGNVRVHPYRIQAECACDRCEYNLICRFDAWTTPYRVLKARPRKAH